MQQGAGQGGQGRAGRARGARGGEGGAGGRDESFSKPPEESLFYLYEELREPKASPASGRELVRPM